MPALKSEALIASMQLRHGEELRVMLSPYRGQTYLHIRRWYQEDGRWKPGKGASARVDVLPWLLNALRTTEATALEEGVLLPEDYENVGLPAPEEP